ncbi:MAG: UxaA family hydrolase [Clostridiales bacterium]|nr:UxaA family hydrolase [Clostridiales bacterium]
MSAINAVHVSDRDSCVTVTVPVAAGDTVSYHCGDGSVASVKAGADIPIYHKIAVIAIGKDDFVYKYGEKIGIAKDNINPGDYVHIHNIKPVGFVEEA